MSKSNFTHANVTGARGLVLFDRGRAVPRSDFGLWLAIVGEKLAREPKASVRLVGHANLRETPRSAELLGMKRANAVASSLVAFGGRIGQIHVMSQGARAPATTPTGRAEPALGRRVELFWDVSA